MGVPLGGVLSPLYMVSLRPSLFWASSCASCSSACWASAHPAHDASFALCTESLQHQQRWKHPTSSDISAFAGNTTKLQSMSDSSQLQSSNLAKQYATSEPNSEAVTNANALKRSLWLSKNN
jgi:hypothetical protein